MTIDPYDATWRLFGFKVQDRFPAVQQLAIHEEGQQSVIFKEGEALNALESVKDTTLMAFLSSTHPNKKQGKSNIKIFLSSAHLVEMLGIGGKSYHQMLKFLELLEGSILFHQARVKDIF